MAKVQYFGTGRRKSSVARVRLLPGEGSNHKKKKMTSAQSQILSAIRDGDIRLAHELMAQSHFALCDEISSISENV